MTDIDQGNPSEVAEVNITSITVEGDGVTATFRVADRIGALAMMRLGKMAGADPSLYSDLEWLGAMFTMIQQVVADEEWGRFEKFCTEQRVEIESLQKVLNDAMEVMSRRPTKSRSGSASGQTETAPVWSGDSSAPESWTPAEPTSSMSAAETSSEMHSTSGRPATTEERFASQMQAWTEREPVTSELMSVIEATRRAKSGTLSKVG